MKNIVKIVNDTAVNLLNQLKVNLGIDLYKLENAITASELSRLINFMSGNSEYTETYILREDGSYYLNEDGNYILSQIDSTPNATTDEIVSVKGILNSVLNRNRSAPISYSRNVEENQFLLNAILRENGGFIFREDGGFTINEDGVFEFPIAPVIPPVVEEIVEVFSSIQREDESFMIRQDDSYIELEDGIFSWPLEEIDIHILRENLSDLLKEDGSLFLPEDGSIVFDEPEFYIDSIQREFSGYVLRQDDSFMMNEDGLTLFPDPIEPIVIVPEMIPYSLLREGDEFAYILNQTGGVIILE